MPQPTHLDTKTSPRLTAMDRIVRYVLLPIVLAIGLHGLVHYVVTGDAAIRPAVTVMPQGK